MASDKHSVIGNVVFILLVIVGVLLYKIWPWPLLLPLVSLRSQARAEIFQGGATAGQMNPGRGNRRTRRSRNIRWECPKV